MPDPHPFTQFVPTLASVAALLLAIFSLLRKESREDGQTTPQRLKKVEGLVANLDVRITGFQQEIEGVADRAHRDTESAKESHRRDLAAMSEKVSQVPQVLDRLGRLETRLDNTGKTVDKLEGKIDRILELLTLPRLHT